MRQKITIAVCAVLLMSVSGLANAQALCGERSEIIKTLSDKYSEVPRNMGLAGNGGVLEIFASQTGTWTIIVTQPSGTTCVVSTGEAWEELAVAEAPDGDQI